MLAKQQELVFQAESVAASALSAPEGHVQSGTIAGAETLARLARYEERKALQARSEPILDLADNASPREVREARLKRAVRRGRDVYLPTWRDLTVGLPNVWLRSALFSASKLDRGWFSEEPLLTQGDVSITYTGHALCQYDQLVYATCLDFYRNDRPLSPGGAHDPWVSTSYYLFAQAMGRAYGANVHQALRDSLLRLSSANLRIRVSRLDMPIPRLLEVAFEDGVSAQDLKGSDAIAFRIHESVAHLFGPDSWSAIDKEALGYQGLQAWLAAYYGSHSVPRWVPISTLKELSGLTCTMSDFRRQLGRALDKLMGADIPEGVRVAAYLPEKLTKDTRAIKVCLSCWGASTTQLGC